MTGNITMKDHGDRHHVISITMMQQQPENPEPTEKLNENNRQNYKMTDIEEFLNDWLRKAV